MGGSSVAGGTQTGGKKHELYLRKGFFAFIWNSTPWGWSQDGGRKPSGPERDGILAGKGAQAKAVRSQNSLEAWGRGQGRG